MAWPEKNAPDERRQREADARQGRLPQVRRLRRDAHRRASWPRTSRCAPSAASTTSSTPTAGASSCSTTATLEEWDAHLEPADPLALHATARATPTASPPRRRSRSAKRGDRDRPRRDSTGDPSRTARSSSRSWAGRMGSVVGEKVDAPLRARRRPTGCRSCSCRPRGGARMQEGILSLMQMAKSVAALERLRRTRACRSSQRAAPPHHRRRGGELRVPRRREHRRAQGPHRLRRPARHRETIRQKLPEGFQRSEFLLAHGMVDGIVSRARDEAHDRHAARPPRPRRPAGGDDARGREAG